MTECEVCGFCGAQPPWWESGDRVIVTSGGVYALLDKATRRPVARWCGAPTFINEPLGIVAFNSNCDVVSLRTGREVKSMKSVRYGPVLLTFGENDAIVNAVNVNRPPFIAAGTCAVWLGSPNTVYYWVNGDLCDGPTFKFEDVETVWIDSTKQLWVCNDETSWQKMCVTK